MAGSIECVELPANAPPPAWALADARVKIVHCVRHGQASHNLFALGLPGPPCGCRTGGSCAYRNVQHEDAQLTARGRVQARAAGARLGMLPGAAVQRVYVSPLTRTLETATIAVGAAGLDGVPVVAEERLRERYGVHICDRRAPREVSEKAFPGVDFRGVVHGEDPLYEYDVRETNEHVAMRAREFLLEMGEREEKVVALVAHSAFWRECMGGAVVTPDNNVTRKFDTGEVRYVMLRYL